MHIVWTFRILIAYQHSAKAPLFEFCSELFTYLVAEIFSEQFIIPLSFLLINVKVCM